MDKFFLIYNWVQNYENKHPKPWNIEPNTKWIVLYISCWKGNDMHHFLYTDSFNRNIVSKLELFILNQINNHNLIKCIRPELLKKDTI